MSKVAVRLFRNPSLAQRAVEKLKAEGYSDDEIGIITGESGKADGLANLLGISEAVFDYYRTGISLGGVLVSLNSEEPRLSQGRAILRAVATEASPEPRGWKPTSPGFEASSRITETDPLDAKFTGDFRKY